MAKKNLHSLMSGIIGTDNNDISTPELSKNPQAVRPDTPTSGQPDNSTSSKPGPGRPKKYPLENDDTRATFVVSAELLRKVKYISLMDDRLQKDVVGEALSIYVSKWEDDNGKIKMPKK